MKGYKGGLQNCLLSLRGLNGAQNEAVPWISPMCHYFSQPCYWPSTTVTFKHSNFFFISIVSLRTMFFFFLRLSNNFWRHRLCNSCCADLLFVFCLFRIRHQRRKTNLTNNLHCSSESFLDLPPPPRANNKEHNLYLMYLWKREMS